MESVSIISIEESDINSHLAAQNSSGYVVNFIYETSNSDNIVALNTPFTNFTIEQYCNVIYLNEKAMNDFITTAISGDYVAAFINHPKHNRLIIGIATKQTYTI